MTEQPDIAIVGGGPAGMIAALSFATCGHSVALIDPAPPGAPPDDLRSTALLAPSLALLEATGTMEALRPYGAPLKVMRLAEVDDAGIVTASHDFEAEEAGLEMFGLNFANTDLKATLSNAVDAHSGITRHVTRARSVLGRDRCAILWLEDGTRLSPALVVAADGRDSFLRGTGRNWRKNLALRAKGHGFRRFASLAPRQYFNRVAPHRWPVHLGAVAR